jgi:hypothetical protein
MEEQRMWTAKEDNVSMRVCKFTAYCSWKRSQAVVKTISVFFAAGRGIVIPILSEGSSTGRVPGAFFYIHLSWHFRFCFSN